MKLSILFEDDRAVLWEFRINIHVVQINYIMNICINGSCTCIIRCEKNGVGAMHKLDSNTRISNKQGAPLGVSLEILSQQSNYVSGHRSIF